MKQTLKRSIGIFLATLLLISAVPFVSLQADASAIVANGECGEKVTWILDSNGLLTISGTGDMYPCYLNRHQPWYQYASDIKSVEIKDGVTNIGIGAFGELTNLSNVSIPNSVTIIETGAFIATNITTITIPNSIISIDESAFLNCKKLTSITIPNSVSNIGISAFQDCNNLTSIIIPNSVKSIEKSCFANCTSLSNITIMNSITRIGPSAFIGTAYYNNEANWDQGVLYIGTHLITAKDDIVGTYTIKPGTTNIAEYAFASHDGLTGFVIPDSILRIGQNAFTHSAYYSDKNNWENDVLYNGEYLISASGKATGTCAIKEGTRVIADGAFNSTDFDNITIPHSITRIGYGAFSGNYTIKQIIIPDSVKYIDKYAFFNMNGITSLTDVYYEGSQFSWDIITNRSEKIVNETVNIHCAKQNPAFLSANKAALTKNGELLIVNNIMTQTFLQLSDDGSKLYKADGTEKQADAKIGTGDKLVLADGTELVVTVLGDINGDGEVATADARLVLRKAVNLETFTAVQDTAANVDGSAEVGVSHARKVLRAAVGLENTSDWFSTLAKQ